MAVVDLFSKRQARLRGEVPDVFVYDEIPQELRVQVWQITRRMFGNWFDERGNNNTRGQQFYTGLVQILRGEYGVFRLQNELLRTNSDEDDELKAHILNAKPEFVLDAVELICRVIARRGEDDSASGRQYRAAVEDINTRFRERGVGYEYVSDEIIRIDSQLVHAEAVKPALALLSEKAFAGAEAEFLSAYEHYRHGKTKEALTDSLKAFESTMKVICARHPTWTVGGKGTAKDLIQTLYDNDLIPDFWQTHFSGLRSVLESGVPTARNRTSGHGQGAEVKEVPGYLASYVLHMTAATIVFLVNADKALL